MVKENINNVTYQFNCVKVKVFYAHHSRTHLKTHRWKSQINATNVTLHPLWQAIRWDIWKYIKGKCKRSVFSVTVHLNGHTTKFGDSVWYSGFADSGETSDSGETVDSGETGNSIKTGNSGEAGHSV